MPGLVVGVGTEVPSETLAERFRAKHGIAGPYVIYIGRIDQNKGCPELFDFFLRFKVQTGSPLKLVLIGNSVLRFPAHPDILPLGFLPEEDKFDGLAGAAALIMPSFYESLSMVTLEAGPSTGPSWPTSGATSSRASAGGRTAGCTIRATASSAKP